MKKIIVLNVLLLVYICCFVQAKSVTAQSETTEMTSGTVLLIKVKYRDDKIDLSNPLFEYFDTSKELWIGGAWYDKKNKYMVIKLRDIYYHYCGMPQSSWLEFKSAASYGNKFNEAIKGNFDCRSGFVPSYINKSEKWKEQIATSQRVFVIIDSASADRGAIKKGATYELIYTSKNGVDNYQVKGPHAQTGDIITRTYSNAKLENHQLSLWGRIYEFDSSGGVWDVHFDLPEKERAGRLSLEKPSADFIFSLPAANTPRTVMHMQGEPPAATASSSMRVHCRMICWKGLWKRSLFSLKTVCPAHIMQAKGLERRNWFYRLGI